MTAKHGLERTEHTVEVGGHQIRIETAGLAGEAVNSNPEWRDIAAAADALGRLAKEAFAEAHRAGAKAESSSSEAVDKDQQRGEMMTYVIAEPCVDLLDKACIEEYPVDCIYEGGRQLYIHPDDCGACEPACPVEAIYLEDDVPEQWSGYTHSNAAIFE